jgi:L-ascorbate metabolism protein UlaG (beta-lactamase superfamily)
MPVQVKQQKVLLERTAADECRLTFINHSTVLLQLEGWNILTDPMWSERASPFTWMGPKRVGQPGVKFEDLPPIDLVLLSHNHYDHMDLPTLRRLAREHQPTFFVPKGNKKYLESKGLTQVKELDWWDREDFSLEYSLHFVPAQHFAGRGLLDRNKTLWGGFVIKGPRRTIYFAGDTGDGPHFAEIQRRLGSPTISLLPMGAIEPRWFMAPLHLSPEEAVQAHLALGCKQSVAIHFGTFQLGDEGPEEAEQRLQKALQEHQLSPEDFWVLQPGECRKVN